MEQNNEVVEVKQPAAKKHSFGAALKEYCRKQTVSLKRKPQNIAFLVVLATAIFNYLVLGTYSEAIVVYGDTLEWLGLMVFINTLFSALFVVAFMYSFPKMKKPPKKKKGKDGKEYFKENNTTKTLQIGSCKLNINFVMLGVFAAMVIVMIVCEVVYYNLALDHYNLQGYATKTAADFQSTESYESFMTAGNLFKATLNYSIVHIVLLAVSAVITFCVPLYTRLLVKINTSKELESAVSNMQEIDLAEDE